MAAVPYPLNRTPEGDAVAHDRRTATLETALYGRRIKARYRTLCIACLLPVQPGDEVCWKPSTKAAVHIACAEAAVEKHQQIRWRDRTNADADRDYRIWRSGVEIDNETRDTDEERKWR